VAAAAVVEVGNGLNQTTPSPARLTPGQDGMDRHCISRRLRHTGGDYPGLANVVIGGHAP
jgi:hypothetical protein